MEVKQAPDLSHSIIWWKIKTWEKIHTDFSLNGTKVNMPINSGDEITYDILKLVLDSWNILSLCLYDIVTTNVINHEVHLKLHFPVNIHKLPYNLRPVCFSNYHFFNPVFAHVFSLHRNSSYLLSPQGTWCKQNQLHVCSVCQKHYGTT